MSEKAQARVRCVATGGEPLDSPCTIWRNFVASCTDRIEQAKADWTAQRMREIAGKHEWNRLP